MGKKSREIECLEKVFKTKNKCRGKVKEFLTKLSNLKMIESERPDFIFTDDMGLVIGLEHFLVDHFSQKNNNGKVASNGILVRKNVQQFVDRNAGSLSELNYTNKLEELNALLGQRLKRHMETTYGTFIEAFKYSLSNHINSYSYYKENIKGINVPYNHSYLGLLIEIKADFCHLYLNDDRGTKKVSPGFVPLFSDIVKIIEQKAFVCDFVILYFGEELYKNSDKVLVFRPKYIKKDLNKQNVRIYEYAAEDCILEAFEHMQDNIQISHNVVSKKGGLASEFYASMNLMCEQEMLDLAWYAFYIAYNAMKNKKNYVCSHSVLYCMEVLQKYLIGWKNKGEWRIEPVFLPVSMEQLKKEEQDFCKIWEINNDKT